MFRIVLTLLAAAFSGAAMAGAGSVDFYHDPDCGCCTAHAKYLRGHGFEVELIPTDDLAAVKAEHGVSDQLAGCHTALIDGYVVEGHVPVGSIERLLEERPAIAGISVPGMPVGSPGMGMEQGLQEPLRVWTIPAADGASPTLHSTYQHIAR